MPNPNFATNPQPTEELYQYAEGPEGDPRLDDAYNVPGDVVDVAQFAAERTVDPQAQDLGPIVVVTRAETPGADGRREIRMYDLTSKYCLDPRTGRYVEVNPHDASQVQAVTIGAQWQTPFEGKFTKYPVWFVARPHTREYTYDQLDGATKKPGVQSPTAVGQQHLRRFFGDRADLG